METDFTKRSTYYYDLPQELIAQTPVEPRSASRLLCVDRSSGALAHHHFYELGQFLRKGDLLVMNDSRVLPARLYGEREDTGSPIEFLLLKPVGEKVWEIICKPGKKAKPGRRFRFGEKLSAEILDHAEDGGRIVRFECEGSLYAVLDEIGQMPLPPLHHPQAEGPEPLSDGLCAGGRLLRRADGRSAFYAGAAQRAESTGH